MDLPDPGRYEPDEPPQVDDQLAEFDSTVPSRTVGDIEYWDDGPGDDLPGWPLEESETIAGTPVASRRPVLLAAVGSAVLTAVLTVGALALFGVLDPEPDRIETIIQQPPTFSNVIAGPTDVVAGVAARAIPSIVTVQRDEGVGGLGPSGSGSGVVYRSDGHILTNDHVVAGAGTLKVVFADGLAFPASVVGTDPLMDIAVLKVDAEALVPLAFADLTQVQIGDVAIAVGNPLGLDGGPSVTSGVVSAFDRTLNANGLGGGGALYGLLQTDAPITRGSSGGALLDAQGDLLGITTAIGVSDVGAEGLGFAVPASLVKDIADDLISDGEVSHAFLGIEGGAAFVDQPDGSEAPLGAEIRDLLDDSAIGSAGAEVGDVIVALDDEPVNSMLLLVARLRSYRAGDDIVVRVDRGGELIDIDLTLDRRP